MKMLARWLIVSGLLAQSCLAAAPAQVPAYASYPATPGVDKKARSINWASNKDAKRFKTLLQRAFKKGPAFAGHYAVATWGCGTDCLALAIIDVQTGDVTYGPIGDLDYAYRLDSRLLVVNSPSAVDESMREFGCPDQWDHYAVVSHYYEWTGTDFRLIADVVPSACPGRM